MDLPPDVSFRYVEGMVRYLGDHGMAHPSHNPSHRGFWGPLEDTPEGRLELGARLREVAHFFRGAVHDERVRTVLAWAERAGLLVVPIESAARAIDPEAN